MADILVNNNFYISTSNACIVDLTPPTFAGINFLDVESRGQIRAGWSAATDATTPIRYEIYIKASTATGLFSTTNIVAVTPNLQYDIFTMPDGSFLVNGTTYYVGVRAIDGVSNRDSNVVSMSVISTGVLTSIDVYRNEMSYSVDDANNFKLTAWSNKNENLAVSPGAVMGSASYQVYDKSGNAVVGMSGSVGSPNAQGIYSFTPVANLLDQDHENYVVKVTISVDGENRINHIPISGSYGTYEIDGVASLDSSNNLIGSFWITENEKIITTNLGTANYETFDANGNSIGGLSETGISADVNGVFTVTPVPLPGSVDTSQSYFVKVTMTVHGVVRSKFIIVDGTLADYTCRAVFSINASNQLEATFWATKNDETAPTAILGTASYQVYDKSGNAVVGVTETGLTADVNGLYHTTPVSAALLTDLTHYVAKVTISVAGKNRVVFKGFTLLGN